MSETRNEPRKMGLLAFLSSSAILAGAGGLIAWGATQNRVDTVERQARQTAMDQREVEREIARVNTQTAVLRSQLDTIILQLRAIDEKLERAEKRQR